MTRPEPRLRAEFLLDRAGAPRTVYLAKGGYPHYEIRLFVEDAPEDTYAVTYILDPSFDEAVLLAENRKERFAEEIASYGDFTVRAKVRARSGSVELAAPLWKALRDYYKERGATNPEIDLAIKDIRAH